MMARLRRLPQKAEEVKVPDLSLLSPAEQDRVSELRKLIGSAKNIHAADLDAVFVEFHDLVKDLPLLGRDDPDQGPLIEVPSALVEYWQRQQPLSPWRSFDFYKLSKVQTLRFVELCEQYGFEEGDDRPAREQIASLAEWQAGDRSELQEMLEIAAS
jgi:hypothetical protein